MNSPETIRHPREGGDPGLPERHPREGGDPGLPGRHPREGGDPERCDGASRNADALGSRLRGNDGETSRASDGETSRASDGGTSRGNDGVSSFSAVILAAGESRRMGGPNKLLLPIGDEPVVRRTVRTILAAGVQETVVVTGHQAREVMRVLVDLPVTLQPNLRHEEGQMRSVAAGVAALARATDAILVCPGDLPLLTVDDLHVLMQAWSAHSDRSIVIPRHAGQRGNPIVFASAYAPEVAAGRRLIGCRKLAQQYPQETWYFEADHDRYTTDIDMPDDYRRVLQRLDLPLAEVA